MVPLYKKKLVFDYLWMLLWRFYPEVDQEVEAEVIPYQ